MPRVFALYLPNHGRVEANFEILAGLSRGLSGGDILNISLNAIHAGSADADPAKWKVTQAMLEREIVPFGSVNDLGQFSLELPVVIRPELE